MGGQYAEGFKWCCFSVGSTSCPANDDRWDKQETEFGTRTGFTLYFSEWSKVLENFQWLMSTVPDDVEPTKCLVYRDLVIERK